MATESPFKKLKNAFYFNLKALFLLEMFKFLFLHFGQAGERLGRKAKVNFKIFNVTNWISYICNEHIARYLEN